MKLQNALVVKLVDTKDLKAEGFTNSILSDTLLTVSGSLKHPIKSHNFKLAFN